MKRTSLYSFERIKSLMVLIKSLKANPKAIGMLFPSSSFLSKELAKQIPAHIIQTIQKQAQEEEQVGQQLYILELGGGTGCVTKEILIKGIPLNRLIVFENSSEMASVLTARFPGLLVVQDDAANMGKYLPQNAKVAVVISSLPFLSLPQKISERIVDVLTNTIQNSLLVQYTYSFKKKSFLEEKGFTAKRKKTVFLNVPPAQVINYSYC